MSREPYEQRGLSAAYVELHCHSNFSFQEGASFPHELLARAAELGYPALALTDHDNLCGAMEFARTARSLGIHPYYRGRGHSFEQCENGGPGVSPGFIFLQPGRPRQPRPPRLSR